jgi:CheY-like chemotaxis protein
MGSILIVDDNLVSLKQISALLSNDYEVSLAKSGELALQICAQKQPDLILLDVEMPGMDGFETIARLKADGGLKQVPVIFLTGNSDAETQKKCMGAGAVDFITKPADTDALHSKIKQHLKGSV